MLNYVFFCYSGGIFYVETYEVILSAIRYQSGFIIPMVLR